MDCSQKWLYIFLPLLGAGLLQIAQARDTKAVYGEDHRREPYEIPTEHFLRQGTHSVAVIMPATRLRTHGLSYKQVVTQTLGDRLHLCPDVSYREQPAPGYCTGFLVGPDILATAGHCIKSALDCTRIALVFDFTIEGPGDSPWYVHKDSVFACSALIARKVDSTLGIDLAFLRLSRKAHGRKPFLLSDAVPDDGQPAAGKAIAMLGHPSGLPLKITTFGVIRDDSHPNYLHAALDSFSGSSGAPVLDKKTGDLVGMLVRGENSYQRREGAKCYEPFICEPNACRGEDLIRPHVLSRYLPTI